MGARSGDVKKVAVQHRATGDATLAAAALGAEYALLCR
jgi:hypothetical protein